VKPKKTFFFFHQLLWFAVSVCTADWLTVAWLLVDAELDAVPPVDEAAPPFAELAPVLLACCALPADVSPL
jgi:hypothetical protein